MKEEQKTADNERIFARDRISKARNSVQRNQKQFSVIGAKSVSEEGDK